MSAASEQFASSEQTGKTAGQQWAEYEETVKSRALKLVGTHNPYYNMVPLMELIREADRLGYAVTVK